MASESVEGLRYEVTLPAEPQASPWCGCPAYCFRSGGLDELGHRSCKHIRLAQSRAVLWTAGVGAAHCEHCGAPVVRTGES